MTEKGRTNEKQTDRQTDTQTHTQTDTPTDVKWTYRDLGQEY